MLVRIRYMTYYRIVTRVGMHDMRYARTHVTSKHQVAKNLTSSFITVFLMPLQALAGMSKQRQASTTTPGNFSTVSDLLAGLRAAAAGNITGGGPPLDVLIQGVGEGDQQVASDSELVSAKARKASRRKAERQYHKALLKAEQMKATEGLASCLPLIGSRTSNTSLPAGAMTPFAAGLPSGAIASGYGPGGGGGPGGLRHAASVESVPNVRMTPEALEYAKARGIYRGEQLSWYVSHAHARSTGACSESVCQLPV